MTLSTATPPEKSVAVSGRILQLDGLRAVAILLVLINHTFRIPLTWAGVDVFFVLSGFLITGILLAKKSHPKSYFSSFYKRRAFRILPTYYLTLLLFGLLFGWSTFHPLATLILPGMNLQQFFTTHVSPLPLWSLAVEEQFYLVFPVIILFTSERTLKRLLIAALIFTPILRGLCAHIVPNEQIMYNLTPFRADLLCAGGLLAIVWKDRTPKIEAFCREKSRWVLLVTVLLLCFSQQWWIFRLWWRTPEAYVWVFSATLISSVALVSWTLADNGWLHHILTWRPMRYIGEVSYTIYLVHLIVISKLENWHVHNPALMFVGALAGSLVWASVSWFLMERPLIRYAARKPKSLAA